jgi:hypothetical protein
MNENCTLRSPHECGGSQCCGRMMFLQQTELMQLSILASRGAVTVVEVNLNDFSVDRKLASG